MLDGILSLIFFSIEFAILILVILLNRDHKFFWSIITLLALLQLYQLTEFLICIGVNPTLFARIGYVIITFLPPTGYMLTTQVVRWRFKDYILGFILGTAFSIYYLTDTDSVVMVDCNPFYATYNTRLPILYSIYYLGIILWSLIILIYYLLRHREKIYTKLSILTIIGYMSFLVPMYIMVLVDPTFLVVIPSVMCKYALFLAITLGIFSFFKKYPENEIKERNSKPEVTEPK